MTQKLTILPIEIAFNYPDLIQFVALDVDDAGDPIVVGTASLAELASYLPRIHTLFVHPAHRARGVGSALVARCILAATDAGKSQIELLVDANNQAAIRLYRRHGFVACGSSRTSQIAMMLDLPPEAPEPESA